MENNEDMAQIIAQAVSAAVAPLQEKLSALQASINPPKPIWENPDWDGNLPDDMSSEEMEKYWAWMDKTYNISNRYGTR